MIYAIGDVHGDKDKLQRMIEFVGPTKMDVVILLGDVIDRGRHSKEVVQYILDLREQGYKIIVVKGDHEDMFIDFLEAKNKKTTDFVCDIYLSNGGFATLESYGFSVKDNPTIDMLPEGHLEFFKSLKPYEIVDDYLFIHAGILPGKPLEEQDEDLMMWIREQFYKTDATWGKGIIFAHTPFKTPFIGKGKIGIDTGSIFEGSIDYGRLTCLRLPDFKIFQINKKGRRTFKKLFRDGEEEKYHGKAK